MQVKRKVQGWRVVIAGGDDAGNAETVQPGAGRTKFALPAILRDVARHKNRIGTLPRDILSECVERCGIGCAKVDIGNMNKPHGLRLRRIPRH